jgi:hypothetical protein
VLKTLTEYLKTPSTIPVELCGCGCGQPLEKNDPAGPQFIVIDKKRVLVNSDCYYEAIGEEIDKHPIGGLGMHGLKVSTFDD